MIKGEYLPVLSKDDGEDVQETDSSWNSSLGVKSVKTRGFLAYLSVLLTSLIINVLLLLHHFSQSCTVDYGKTLYSKYVLFGMKICFLTS